MIIELLTPLMLSTTPIALTENAPAYYDHSAQRAIVEKNVVNKQTAQIRTSTYNGTQTYNYQGRPSDADTDTD